MGIDFRYGYGDRFQGTAMGSISGYGYGDRFQGTAMRIDFRVRL